MDNTFLNVKAVIWRHENPISDLSKESTLFMISSEWVSEQDIFVTLTFCSRLSGMWGLDLYTRYKLSKAKKEFVNMCLKVRANVTEVFLWHRWFFLPLESAVWQSGVAMFLKSSQHTELHNQEWETSLKLNWTKAVYQWSSPPMVAQVQESILVSKTSIQFCTVEFLPIIFSSGLVERFLHKHTEKCFRINNTRNTVFFMYPICEIFHVLSRHWDTQAGIIKLSSYRPYYVFLIKILSLSPSPSVCLSVWLSVWLSVCLSACLPACLCLFVSVSLSLAFHDLIYPPWQTVS